MDPVIDGGQLPAGHPPGDTFLSAGSPHPQSSAPRQRGEVCVALPTPLGYVSQRPHVSLRAPQVCSAPPVQGKHRAPVGPHLNPQPHLHSDWSPTPMTQFRTQNSRAGKVIRLGSGPACEH